MATATEKKVSYISQGVQQQFYCVFGLFMMTTINSFEKYKGEIIQKIGQHLVKFLQERLQWCNATFFAHNDQWLAFIAPSCTRSCKKKQMTCRECELCSGQMKSPISQTLSLHLQLPGLHQTALPALLMPTADLQMHKRHIMLQGTIQCTNTPGDQ